MKHALVATAVAFAIGTSAAYANDTQTNANANDQSSTKMTGKQKATAIGAGSGAAAGALVGGPIGAVVGAGVGAVVGHEGTDAKGHVTDSPMHRDNKVSKAQSALNDKGFNVAVDGKFGPNTEDAVRSFQDKNGLTATGTLDDATLAALGVKS
ncbi:MAG: peptidoglycan-binding domain-containing protein [Betaproteobacteria bacterium]